MSLGTPLERQPLALPQEETARVAVQLHGATETQQDLHAVGPSLPLVLGLQVQETDTLRKIREYHPFQLGAYLTVLLQSQKRDKVHHRKLERPQAQTPPHRRASPVRAPPHSA